MLMQALPVGTIPELLPLLAPDRALQERTQACDSLLPLVTQAGREDGLAPSDAPQLLAFCLSMLQLQPAEIPVSVFKLLQELAQSSGNAKVIIRGSSLDRLAALLRQVAADALLSILALLDALAGHTKYLVEFAKSNVIFELLAVLEDLKPKSAGKRRAASLLLMTLFNAPACCEQVCPINTLSARLVTADPFKTTVWSRQVKLLVKQISLTGRSAPVVPINAFQTASHKSCPHVQRHLETSKMQHASRQLQLHKL